MMLNEKPYSMNDDKPVRSTGLLDSYSTEESIPCFYIELKMKTSERKIVEICHARACHLIHRVCVKLKPARLTN